MAVVSAPGLMIGLTFPSLLEYLDNTGGTTEGLQRRIGLRVLAIITVSPSSTGGGRPAVGSHR